MYSKEYNKTIAGKLKQNNKKQTQRQEEAAKMGDTSFTSHLEGMALRDANVEGGSGYAEATVRDLGFADEKTEGAVGVDPPKRKRTRKSKKVGGHCFRTC